MLISNNFHDDLMASLDKGFPNAAFVRSVLKGKIPGKIWTCEIENNKSALVMTNGPFCFIIGNPSYKTVSKYYSILSNKKNFKLVFPEYNEGMHNCKKPFVVAHRHNYYYAGKYAAIKKSKLESGKYIVENIDGKLLGLCQWGDMILNLFGSLKNFENYGIGACILKDNKVISETYAISCGKFAELGTITNLEYRNMGLSTSLSSFILGYCSSLNLDALWTCNADNLSSNAVAKKLGLQRQNDYKFFT